MFFKGFTQFKENVQGWKWTVQKSAPKKTKNTDLYLLQGYL